MMRGKIKPKEKEEEPEMPTLRKRPVTKDKVHSKSYKIKKVATIYLNKILTILNIY